MAALTDLKMNKNYEFDIYTIEMNDKWNSFGFSKLTICLILFALLQDNITQSILLEM